MGQERDPESVLAFTRRFLTWRRDQPALRLGAIAYIDAPEPLLAFERVWQGERVRCLFNLGPAPLAADLWDQPHTLPGYGWLTLPPAPMAP